MKRYLLAITAAIVLAGCSKNEKSITERDTLTGSWQLTEEYASFGGPGQWQPADPLHPSFISFADHDMIMTNEGRSTKYHMDVIDSTRLKISDSRGEYTYGYSLEKGQLILSPPCIEGCMRKYRPVLRID